MESWEKKYEGEFKNGEIEGKRIFTYEDQIVYNGLFENRLKMVKVSLNFWMVKSNMEIG